MSIPTTVNTFGTPYAQYPLYDRRVPTAARERFRRAGIPELDYANSLYVSSGRTPARGWLLLRKADYDLLAATGGLYATNFQLVIADTYDTSVAPLVFNDLAIVQARCVTAGLLGDTDALYLVEVTDSRGVVWNRWSKWPISQMFNVPAPAYDDQIYEDSASGAAPYTWSEMVQVIWQTMPLLGAYQGLPISPTSVPESFALFGVSAWDALSDILEHLGLTVAVDLTAAAQYTIVDQGAADAALATLQATYAGRLEDDWQWVDVGSGRVPGSVVVFFHRKADMYGTEETVRADTLQWESEPAYAVAVAAPAFFAGAQGKHVLWDDFMPRYDIDGVILAADAATAATIAAERVRQYYANVYSGTSGFLRQVYAGALPFRTSAQCDGVKWFQDFRTPNHRGGWRTEICRGADPVFAELA